MAKKGKKNTTPTRTADIPADAQKKMLKALVPEDQASPRGYLNLVKSQALGVDKKGNPRPDIDLLYFLQVCERTGLDPLTNQIYAVYRWNSREGRETMTIQTGIDGLRLVAQRSGQYGGQDDAVFTPEDESADHPTKATVTVYRLNPKTGERMPVTASARWNEYVQLNRDGEPTGLWVKMPYTMLAKCSEALALRKAFPNELSGVYAEEEMQQASNPLADLPAPKSKEKKEEPEALEGEVDENGDGEATDTKKPEPVKSEAAEKTAENVIENRKKLKEEKEKSNQDKNGD